MSRTSAAAAKALTSSHFELFGLVPAFALDGARLDAAFRDIQAEVHPDRYARAGDAERRASLQMTTRVNEAYRTLKSPVRRAQYLLALNGVDVAFETETAMPQDFLLQQMELREELEGAKDAAALDVLSRKLLSERRDLERQIADRIDVEKNFEIAKPLVRKLMFLERLGEEIHEAYETREA